MKEKSSSQDKKEQSLSETAQKKILKVLLERFERDDQLLQRYLPDVYQILKGRLRRGRKGKALFPLSFFQELGNPVVGRSTERGRKARMEKIETILEKFRRVGSVSKEEALEALEFLLALGGRKEALFNQILEIFERTWRISLLEGKRRREQIRQGEVQRRIFLFRGVTLGLTWDFRLIWIERDPKALEARKKALSFVGMAEDVKSDVALEHDQYFTQGLL